LQRGHKYFRETFPSGRPAERSAGRPSLARLFTWERLGQVRSWGSSEISPFLSLPHNFFFLSFLLCFFSPSCLVDSFLSPCSFIIHGQTYNRRVPVLQPRHLLLRPTTVIAATILVDSDMTIFTSTVIGFCYDRQWELLQPFMLMSRPGTGDDDDDNFASTLVSFCYGRR
jgi:hypothetical protein